MVSTRRIAQIVNKCRSGHEIRNRSELIILDTGLLTLFVNMKFVALIVKWNFVCQESVMFSMSGWLRYAHSAQMVGNQMNYFSSDSELQFLYHSTDQQFPLHWQCPVAREWGICWLWKRILPFSHFIMCIKYFWWHFFSLSLLFHLEVALQCGPIETSQLKINRKLQENLNSCLCAL